MLHAMPTRKNTRTSSAAHTSRDGKRTGRKPHATRASSRKRPASDKQPASRKPAARRKPAHARRKAQRPAATRRRSFLAFSGVLAFVLVFCLALAANPNGSALAIEGITSPDGRVFGKMGHSERNAPGLYANIPDATYQPLVEGGVGYFA